MSCEHADFIATVNIDRITDVERFAANVEVCCSACAERFVFIGMRAGVLPDEPTVSVDGLQARLPMRPAAGKPGGIMAGYTVRGTWPPHGEEK